MTRKILCVALAALFISLTAMSMVSCGGQKKSEFGGAAVAIMPQYIGEGEDDPYYQFTMDDLEVQVIYADSLMSELTEKYTVTTTTDAGYFQIEVEWNGLTGDILIPIGKEAYQTYKANLDAKRAEIAESLAAESESLAAEAESLAAESESLAAEAE